MMRWPWVARSAYDLLLAEQAKSEQREQAWVARHDELLVRCTDLLKRQVPEPPVLRERTRDEVIEAILTKAGNNGAMRAHLSSWAAMQRRAGVPDTTIIPQILTWSSPDDDDVVEGDH